MQRRTGDHGVHGVSAVAVVMAGVNTTGTERAMVGAVARDRTGKLNHVNAVSKPIVWQ